MKDIEIFLKRFAIKNKYVRKVFRSLNLLRYKIKFYSHRSKHIDDKMIIFESFCGRSYSCSPKAIYEEMIKDIRFKEYKFIWVLNNKSIDIISHENLIIVKYRSKDFYKYYSLAKYWINNSILASEIKKKKGQVYIQCWHGTPFKKIGIDIVENTKSTMYEKNEINKRYNNEGKIADYFLSPSMSASKRFMSAFNIEQEKLLEIGYPRNDRLIKYNKSEIENIKKRLNIPLNKKVILYAPTWRDNEYDYKIGYIMNNLINFNYLKEQLSDDYVVLFRSHYLISKKNSKLEGFNGFIYDVSFYEDINDLFIISDLLLTDYSSVFYDYANLKKPIIFYMKDLDFYKNSLRGLYTSFDELPGKIVNTEKDIVQIIANINEYQSSFSEIYNVFNQIYNYLDSGDCSKRLIGSIFK